MTPGPGHIRATGSETGPNDDFGAAEETCGRTRACDCPQITVFREQAVFRLTPELCFSSRARNYRGWSCAGFSIRCYPEGGL